MRVIVACEFTQIVTSAFRNLGVEAYSCDVDETEGNTDWHFQEDIFEVLKREKFDLMIAHPPCTFLSYCGYAHWTKPGRVMARIDAAQFFMKIWESEIAHICIENPRGIMSEIFRKPDMEFQPHWFGDKTMKRTNLWLKNLPALKYHKENTLFGDVKTAVEKPKAIATITQKDGRNRIYREYDMLSKENRGKERSRFFPCVAAAMAKQWTEFYYNQSRVKKYFV